MNANGGNANSGNGQPHSEAQPRNEGRPNGGGQPPAQNNQNVNRNQAEERHAPGGAPDTITRGEREQKTTQAGEGQRRTSGSLEQARAILEWSFVSGGPRPGAFLFLAEAAAFSEVRRVNQVGA